MKTSPKSTTVPLYVLRNKIREIIAASFELSMLNLQFGASAPEIHQAKSKTTRGMYGKLFALSGAPAMGGKALNASLTSKQRRKNAKHALDVRWGKQ